MTCFILLCLTLDNVIYFWNKTREPSDCLVLDLCLVGPVSILYLLPVSLYAAINVNSCLLSLPVCILSMSLLFSYSSLHTQLPARGFFQLNEISVQLLKIFQWHHRETVWNTLMLLLGVNFSWRFDYTLLFLSLNHFSLVTGMLIFFKLFAFFLSFLHIFTHLIFKEHSIYQ